MTDIKRTNKSARIKVYKYGTDKFKSESISIYFSVPSNREASVARSLLLSVLKRGTQKYVSQRAINERLDELYATLVNFKNQKFEGVQLLGASADLIKSAYVEDGEDILPQVLEVISQMLFYPAIDEKSGAFYEEYVKSEKENYKSIILSQINEPRTFASIRCREEMFSSLGIIDNLDTMCQKIESVSADDLVNQYREIISTAEIMVFYVGERSIEEVYDEVSKIIPTNEGTNHSNEGGRIKLLKNLDKPNEIIEDSDTTQGRLIMGFNCQTTWQDEDYYAMLLCNEILGASPISKLFMSVREKMSLCYECSSVYNSARGALFVTTGIDSDNYELAKAAIIEQVEKIKCGEISEDELSAAKKSICNGYSAVADSPSAIEKFYLGRIINDIDVDISGFLAKINALSLDDVIRAANSLSLHTVYFLRGDESEGGNELDE